jgi:poly(3-hydroxybutyrate) depolymerase
LKADLGGVNLEDQVTALRALAASVPELDLARVGITGWSFGGYLSALGVMKRPDVFKAAVSGAPVADWRDYDTFYTERYLGLPQENATSYDRNSIARCSSCTARPTTTSSSRTRSSCRMRSSGRAGHTSSCRSPGSPTWCPSRWSWSASGSG